MTGDTDEKNGAENKQQCQNCNSSGPTNQFVLISFLKCVCGCISLRNESLFSFFLLTFKMWFNEIPISGRRISPAAFVAIVMFFWTMSNELMSIESAVWLETGSSKISASSVNWGRIFWVRVCSRAFVWFRTDETRLSTFRPASKTSSSPLCKSSFPYKPKKRKM